MCEMIHLSFSCIKSLKSGINHQIFNFMRLLVETKEQANHVLDLLEVTDIGRDDFINEDLLPYAYLDIDRPISFDEMAKIVDYLRNEQLKKEN